MNKKRKKATAPRQAPGGATVTAPAHGPYDVVAALSRENFAAIAKVNVAWADSVEALAREAVGYARQTLAVAETATKELLVARTLDRVVEIHAGVATAVIEALVERATRLSELGIALANGGGGGRRRSAVTHRVTPLASR